MFGRRSLVVITTVAISAFCFLCLLSFLSGCQVLRLTQASREVSLELVPFEQIRRDAKLKILILGDSTAVGTGAKDNTESVAGWFGRDFPKAHIRNFGRNGQRLADLLKNFPSFSEEEKFDLVVLQIGANDVIHLTRLKHIKRNVTAVVDRAKTVGQQVVLMHSGDVGLAPIFSWPLNRLFSARTRALREIYLKVAKEKNVMYVDLFRERKGDLFLTDINKYYSVDRLHPSGAGYRYWYEEIRRTLVEHHVQLEE